VQQLQIQLEALIAKEENRPFLNLNYENEQASILQASLSKKLVSHLEALAAKGKKKSGQKPSEGSGQVGSLLCPVLFFFWNRCSLQEA